MSMKSLQACSVEERVSPPEEARRRRGRRGREREREGRGRRTFGLDKWQLWDQLGHLIGATTDQ